MIKKVLSASLVAAFIYAFFAGTAIADHNGADLSNGIDACGETTVDASISDPNEDHVDEGMYLVVHADGKTEYTSIPVDGSTVSITVGPFTEVTNVQWRVYGGDNRSYDQPLWNGYGTSSFTSDINDYADEVGDFDWVLSGPDDPNPFITWSGLNVAGCEDAIAPTVEITSPVDGETVNGLVDIAGSVTDNIELEHYNLSLYPGSTDLSDGGDHLEDRLNDSNWCTDSISGTVNLSDDFSGLFCDDWDTTNFPDGEYQIRLAAKDLRANFDSSDTENGGTSSVHVINFTIHNTPFTKDECKDGEWENLIDEDGNSFKNQGHCVSYVASGGKSRNGSK